MYYSIENEELYGYFFNCDLIKTNQINKATIYTTETNSQESFIFLQAKLLFDSNGNIIARYDYNQNGKPHLVKEYFRDNTGKVIRTSLAYLRENETKYDLYSPTIVDFTYNQVGQLIKTKERDYNGNILADSLSNYTKYGYDSTRRLINEYRYANYGGNIDIYNKTIKYTNQNESISITRNNGKNWLKTIFKYDNKKRLISRIDYDYPDNKIVSELYYKFENDKLIRQISKTGTGVTECPDNNDFTEDYIYNNFGLLKRIIHKFDNITCEMTITYE